MLVFLCFLAVFYAYFGYPLVLYLLTSGRARRASSTTDAGKSYSVTVIIAARNEERVIAQKLENTLALEFGGIPLSESLSQGDGLVQVIVASDASDDRTDEIVRSYQAKGIELVSATQRFGKEAVQRQAVDAARGEIIVFTDAKINLPTDALEKFSRYFNDSTVGAVSTTDVIESNSESSSGEGFYIKYEMALRALESDFDSLIGLSGSCFAVRKELCSGMDTTLPSDFALLLEARKQGLRGVHAPDIIASYQAVKSEKEEFTRKVRTVLRGISTLMANAEIMNPLKYGSFAWQVISHKLMRWLVPWFLGIAFIVTLYFARYSVFYQLLLTLELGLVFVAALALLAPNLQQRREFKVPLFFCLVNAAIAMAWIKYLSGERQVSWEPSAKAPSSEAG